MKTLSEQVRDYLENEGLTPAAFAKLVKVSRQNIENVLAGNVKTPRYLPAIARVMGTTVEDLVAGRYRHGRPAGNEAPDALAPADIEHLEMVRSLSSPARQLLAAYLQQLKAMDSAGAQAGDASCLLRAGAPSRKRAASGQ